MIGTIVFATILCCLVITILIYTMCVADSRGDFECHVGALFVVMLVCFLAGLTLREAFEISDADQASKNSAVIQSLPRPAEKP